MPGWGRSTGNALGQDYDKLARMALPAHVSLVLSMPVPVPAPGGTLGHSPFLIPFPSLKQKREGGRLRGMGVSWPDPIITQSKPHPGSVTNSLLKTIRKRIPHAPLLKKHFHLFNNPCIISGSETRGTEIMIAIIATIYLVLSMRQECCQSCYVHFLT